MTYQGNMLASGVRNRCHRKTVVGQIFDAATREAIEAGGVLSPDGRLHLKHIAAGFGFVAPGDLARGVLSVVADADALIRAGWAVD